METETIITAIISAFGVLGVKELTVGFFRWIAGRSERQSKRFEDLLQRAEDAEEEARVYREYASKLRNTIIMTYKGDPEQLAPWPNPPHANL